MSNERKRVLIVAHGLSTDVAGSMARLTVTVDQLRNLLGDDWHLEAAILSSPDTMTAALARLGLVSGMPLLVWPHFIVDGYFVSRKLPDLLQQNGFGPADTHILPPLGTKMTFPAICCEAVMDVMEPAKRLAPETDLVLVAHGSAKNPAAFDGIIAIALHLQTSSGFRQVKMGFLEQEPYLSDLDLSGMDGYCLPLFAQSGDHVSNDIPPALQKANFAGELLPPVGETMAALTVIAMGLKNHDQD